MRDFIRHPSDIPIAHKHSDAVEYTKEKLKNIGHGGLCFNSRKSIKAGTIISLQIHIREPAFEANGVVTWCNKVDDHYEIGVTFNDEHTEFGIRMVEQICYIEHYKREVLKNEGRILSGKDAALEWVKKNAADFPK
ncbi:MAG: PilZ domain-containing protein [Candidatus Cloacimonetes bacterium]|jgi:hypothetical protein|nr:PilZ domain-containing protein [Candidatus Cloacimonadota bacterium]